MLGSDKSRGYCLEMICVDFLAGVSLETGSQDDSSVGPHGAATWSSDAAAGATPQERSGGPLTGIRSKRRRLRLKPEAYRQLCNKVRSGTVGIANSAGEAKAFKSITFARGAASAMTRPKIPFFFNKVGRHYRIYILLQRESWARVG
jgi:hypothetical protein